MKLEPIAIIGIGCRFPGADHPEAFWHLLRDGVDAITEVPRSRWNVDELYDPDPAQPDKTNTRWGGFLEQVDRFDPQFFNIAPREAVSIDPQQRLMLEVAWEALEDAGQIPEQLAGTQTGVFVGIGTHDYSVLLWQNPVNDPHATTGTGNCIAANRISYVFDFRGPSLAIDTACSSSLVAVHLACQSLWRGESTLALAGGVNVLLLSSAMVGFTKSGFMAPDGRCKTFDARADGYVRGEGAGLVVLKPLSQAEADGDRIYAVIRGGAVNQDGRSNGLTAPNPQAQEAVLRTAYQQAGVSPGQVQYIEVHGTGTKLGDPMELKALGKVLSEQRPVGEVCAVGSVKTNIGHLETAAGIAGLIKVALSLHHQQILPSLHFQTPNPYIDFNKLPFRVQQTLAPWANCDRPALAGISSFGFGGTNAHVVLEAAPVQSRRRSPVPQRLHLLTLSAKSAPALGALVQRYQTFLGDRPDLDLADVCFTANAKRSHFNHRLAVVAASTNDLLEQLTAIAAHRQTECWLQGQVTNRKAPPIAFLFTGQGSQYVGMGQQLYETQPVFREAIDRCDQILRPDLDTSLLEVLYPQRNQELRVKGQGKPSFLLDTTAYTQPALFALEYALAQLWMSWGITPSIVMGHSVGEYVAACIAGVFSLEDGLKLIAARSRLMQALPDTGRMVAVLADEASVRAMLPSEDQVAIAAVNSPKNTVISGETEAIASLVANLHAKGIKTVALNVSHAFHSPLMAPMLAEFAQVAAGVSYCQPQIKLVSNITGDLATEAIATPAYWCQHVQAPVQFAASMATLARLGYQVFVEIGAKPTLLGMGRACSPSADSLWLPSLHPDRSDERQLLKSLSELYIRGAKVDWSSFTGDRPCQIIPLPTYPFQRQRYWWESDDKLKHATTERSSSTSNSPDVHPLLGERLYLAGTSEIRFQSHIRSDAPAYLKDHCVFSQTVLPATAYLEMALAAGADLLQSEPLCLENVVIEKPLILVEGESKTLQLILKPIGDAYSFQIFSFIPSVGNSCTLHAFGSVARLAEATAPSIDRAVESACPQTRSLASYYQQLQTQGLQYGSCFQSIQQLQWGERQAFGQICLPDVLVSEATDYQLHPVLLDASFQVLGAMFADVESRSYLPAGCDRLNFYSRPSSRLWSYAQLTDFNAQQVQADVWLTDEAGRLVAEVKGLSLRIVNPRSLKPQLNAADNPEHWLYEIDWQLKALPASLSQSELHGNWLIFADAQGFGSELANLLREQGDRCTLIFPNESYSVLTPETYCLNPAQPEHFQQLLQDVGDHPLRGVIHCWGLTVAAAEPTLTDLETAQLKGCGSVLHLVQALMQIDRSNLPPLWLITRGTQAIAQAPSVPLQLQQAPLWGLGRVINKEHPDWRCICLDLDPTAPTSDPRSLWQEFLSPDVEDQIAYRQGDRYVARLVRRSALASGNADRLQIPPDRPFQLKTLNPGMLDRLTLMPAIRRPLAADEVEIQVCAAGLNFRDVLNALGMLQSHQEQVTDAADLPFGGECAGKITAVGAAVTQFQPGDEVIAAEAIGCLGSFVTVKAQFVVPKPKALTFVEAATIPIAFLTAYYGLHHLAKIRSTEAAGRRLRVLIHAAAGGVGQAAVQIAQRAGADVFATASPAKWDRLRAMGVKHVMNSRTLDFAAEVKALTQGQGVDVVFNCLNGEFIPKSLEVLAASGQFIEIGKIGKWEQHQVQQYRPDVAYFPFDLLEVCQQHPDLITALLSELMQQLQLGQLQPLPHTVFPIQEAVSAFRYMAQAKHVGKVVITIPERPQFANSQFNSQIQPNSQYVISGGLGALGLQVAQWLVKQGATHLVLMGRHQPSAIAQATIQQLEQAGAQVQIVQADVANPQAVAHVVQQCQRAVPLRGVIHAAGILDDGLLLNLSWQRFSEVMAPKAAGAWNLHTATRSLSLDFFICFSSIASLLGAPGQGNYAAANAFLDALAHYRQSLGLPSLSINWAPWTDGMASRLAEQNRERLTARGITPLTSNQGLQALEALLHQDVTQVGVLSIDWSKFLTHLPSDVTPFLAAVLPAEPAHPGDSTVLHQLQKMPVGDRKPFLRQQISTQAAKVLGFNAATLIDPQQDLAELGMDSLMAVEFMNAIQTLLGRSIAVSAALNCSTVDALVNYLIQQVLVTEFMQDTAVSVALDQQIHSLNGRSLQGTHPTAATSPAANGASFPLRTSPAFAKTRDIPLEYYQFDRSPEYLNMRRYLEEMNQTGNPFFTVHEGIARDVTQVNGQELINYASYNYLGLSGDPTVAEAAKAAIDRYGTSVSASRVVSGERPIHRALEQEIAAFIGTEDCIVYVGGHTTNETTIGHLFGKNDLILYDALSHNSIRQGCALSKAHAVEFPHNDWQTLDDLLHQHRHHYEKVLIAIEGIYSTDGDIAPLPEIVEVKQRYKAFLLVDEAHSIGVLGKCGRGISEYFGIAATNVDLWMGTLSKSFASCGGYIAGSNALVEYLKYTAPGFVFSVGMSPANAAAALAALQQLQAQPDRVSQLHDRASRFLELARSSGLNTGASQDSPIVPVIIGEPAEAVKLSQLLFDRGINVQPMVYPSVAYNAARLRFFITATHTEAQIHYTIKTLVEEISNLQTAANGIKVEANL